MNWTTLYGVLSKLPKNFDLSVFASSLAKVEIERFYDHLSRTDLATGLQNLDYGRKQALNVLLKLTSPGLTPQMEI